MQHHQLTKPLRNDEPGKKLTAQQRGPGGIIKRGEFVAIAKIQCKQIFCTNCKTFKVVRLEVNECPRCHLRFRCAPVDYIMKKVRH